MENDYKMQYIEKILRGSYYCNGCSFPYSIKVSSKRNTVGNAFHR